MKIIEGMKKLKDLNIKAEDLREKISNHCADLNVETPLYADQGTVVSGWLQSHGDLVKEILRLRIAIQKTNLATDVEISLDGKPVKKTIAEWIHRRRDLAGMERLAWKQLSDRGLREGIMKDSQGQEKEVKIRRYFDPKERDQKIDSFRSEPMTIDATLEVVNATTDLI